jgi:hypothetical protein
MISALGRPLGREHGSHDTCWQPTRLIGSRGERKNISFSVAPVSMGGALVFAIGVWLGRIGAS